MTNSLTGFDRTTNIIIYSINNLEQIKLCIKTIKAFTNVPYCITVVDDNSTDDTVIWLNQQYDIKSILNNQPIGFVKSINKATRLAEKNADILLLNPDVIVTPQWLSTLKSALYSSDNVGAVNPLTNDGFWHIAKIKIDFEALDFEALLNFSEKIHSSLKGNWSSRTTLSEFCMLIKREAFDNVGLFDETFVEANLEDEDYSFRLLLKGYTLLLCKDVFVQRIITKSYEYDETPFLKKWGFSALYSNGVRGDIINLMKLDTKKINVLEVGCGCGGTLMAIKNINPNANLYGIELDSGSSKIASVVADVKNISVEEENLGYSENFFDYIIFGDVLEHLYNPWKVLDNIKKYLKSDGVLIASIPNIMYFNIIKDMLNGNWTYQDFGILDRTHIRFFTRAEIVKMFLTSGYTNLRFAINLHEKDTENFIDKLLELSDLHKRQEFEAYQYIVCAQKANF